jgi:hypothetical protein
MYKRIKPYVEQSINREIDPVAGTNLKGDRFIIYELKTGPTEFAILSNQPFFASYRMTYHPVNQAGVTQSVKSAPLDIISEYKDKYIAAFDEQSKTVSVEKSGIPEAQIKRMVHLNNSLGPAAFFSHYEATINGYNLLEGSNLSTFQYLYQALNRFFATKEDLKSCFGEDLGTIIDKSSLRDFRDPSPELVKNLKSAQFSTDTAWKTRTFGFDSCPLFGVRNFAFSKLMGSNVNKNQYAVLPPNVHLIVKLFLTESAWQRMEFPLESFTYMSNQPTEIDTDIPTHFDNPKIEFNKLTLRYNSMKITDPKVLAKCHKASLHHFTDLISYQQFTVPVQQSLTRHSVLVRRHTRMLMITFPKTWQLYNLSRPNKHQNARFLFPRYLDSVKLIMPGNEELGYPGGYSSLGEGSYNAQVPYSYYQSLIDAKVIDCPYDHLFPEDEYDNKSISFRQAILVDLTQRKINQDTQMALECKWKTLPAEDAEADRDLNILVFSLQEAALIRDKDRYRIEVL